jgi:hypothetical protein
MTFNVFQYKCVDVPEVKKRKGPLAKGDPSRLTGL